MTDRIRTHKQLEHDLTRAREKIATLEHRVHMQAALMKSQRRQIDSYGKQIKHLTEMLKRGPKAIAAEFARSIVNMIEAAQ